MAFRTAYTDILNDRLGVAAFRKSGAGQEFAEPAQLIDHRLAAFLTQLIGDLIFNLDFLHFFFRI
ncbi:hypothetical protein D3C86_2232510 [compost metagenome]